ncbi:NADH-quinone oxidoreductase subunit C [Patescibacteria group bacterium]|nr:MAG: NADH-quinone oxidoreductase subunit C [Patescibacteria group bacterium]
MYLSRSKNMTNLNSFTTRFPDAKVLEQNEKLLFVEIGDLKLLVAVGFLMENGFGRLISLGGADYQDRMEGIYHFGRYDGKPDIIALKVKIPKSLPVLPSIAKLIPGANWHERETYDLLGIKFEGHPDLARIFLPADFPGYPLRKDWHGEDTVPLLFGDDSGEPPTNLIEKKIYNE